MAKQQICLIFWKRIEGFILKKFNTLMALLFSLLMICFSSGCEKAEEVAPTLVQQNVKSVEVGEKVNDFASFFTCWDGAAIELGDLSNIDINTVGTYDIPTITHYKKAAVAMKYPFEVIDTTPPELQVDKTKIELYVGMTYKPDEIIKATATDNSGENVNIKYAAFPMLLTSARKTNGKIIATDTSGNSTSTDIDVIVKDIKTQSDLYSYLNNIISTNDKYKNVTYDSEVIEGLSYGGTKYYDDETVTTLYFPITKLNTNNKDIIGGYCVEIEISDHSYFSSSSAYYSGVYPYLELRFQKDYKYLSTDKIVITSSTGSIEHTGSSFDNRSSFDNTVLNITDDEKKILYGDNPTLIVSFKENGTITIPLSSTDIDTIKNAFELHKTIQSSIPMY